MRRHKKNHDPKSEIRNPQSGGFTLIEVLLAMAILAVIITVIYTSFSTAERNIKQAEESRDDTDVARTLISRLSDDIANAYVNPSMNQGMKDPATVLTIFYGKKEEVGDGEDKVRHDGMYLTTLTNWRRPDTQETELWEVGYYFKEKPEGQGYALYRREKRVLSKDVPALEGGDEYEITDRVVNLRFRYTSDGKNWVDEWDSRPKALGFLLPKAVEITLTLDSGAVHVTEVGIVSKAS
jgi:general secretion pathway protein J